MIRVLLIIFISMSLKANLLERDDVKKFIDLAVEESNLTSCLLYTSPSPRD